MRLVDASRGLLRPPLSSPRPARLPHSPARRSTGQRPTPGQPPTGQPPAAAPAPLRSRARSPRRSGLLFNTVRPDRVADFEKAMGYLQAALASSTNERVRAQAKGWRVFKATEPGRATRCCTCSCSTRRCRARTTARANPGRCLPRPGEAAGDLEALSGSVTGGSLLNLTPLKRRRTAARSPSRRGAGASRKRRPARVVRTRLELQVHARVEAVDGRTAARPRSLNTR